MSKISQTDKNYIYTTFEPNKVDEAKVLGVHLIEDLDHIPVDLEQDYLYTLTRWDRVFYGRATGKHSVEVLESRGGDFIGGEEYLIILPKY